MLGFGTLFAAIKTLAGSLQTLAQTVNDANVQLRARLQLDTAEDHAGDVQARHRPASSTTRPTPRRSPAAPPTASARRVLTD